MHECNAMQILIAKKKKKKTKNSRKNGHKEFWDEAQGPKEPRMTRDKELHQSLDEVSQTHFYQEVWWRC